MKNRAWYLGRFALVGIICASLASPPVNAADLKTVVAGVITTYAQIKTYQDNGVVLTHDTTKEQPDEILFRTHFDRSGRYRFDWISHHPYPPLRHIKTPAVIRLDAGGAHMFTDFSNTPAIRKDYTSLDEITKAAMGVSRRSSWHVPRLLSSQITGPTLFDLSDLRLENDDVFEGVPCHRIKGTSSRGGTCEIWIGQSDSLIRRVLRVETATLSNGRIIPPTEEIHRDIILNAPIPDAEFQVKT